MDRLARPDLEVLWDLPDLWLRWDRSPRSDLLARLAPLDPSSRLVRLRPLDLADLPPLNWCLLVRLDRPHLWLRLDRSLLLGPLDLWDLLAPLRLLDP